MKNFSFLLLRVMASLFWLSTAIATMGQSREYDRPAAIQEIQPPSSGRIVSNKTDSAIGVTELELSNGVTITLKSMAGYKKGDIHMDCRRPGGCHQFSLSKKVNGEISKDLTLAMGVEGLNAARMDSLFEERSMYVVPVLEDDDEGIQGGIISRHDFRTLLQLTYLYLAKPAFDQSMVRTFLDSEAHLIEYCKRAPLLSLLDSVNRFIYGNNPWAPQEADTKAELVGFNADSASAIYKSIFGNAYGFHFTFVGDFDIESIKPMLALWLGGLPSKPSHHGFVDVNLKPVKRGNQKIVMDGGSDSYTQVVLISKGQNTYSQREAAAMRLTEAILNAKISSQTGKVRNGSVWHGSGSFGSLWEPVFPKDSYTTEGIFMCTPGKSDSLVNLAFEVVDRLEEAGPTPSDLDEAKRLALSSSANFYSDNEHLAMELSVAWMHQRDYLSVLAHDSDIVDISSNDIKDILRKYYQRADFVEAVLNPEVAKN